MDILDSADRVIQEHVRPYAWPLVFVTLLTIMALGPHAFNILLAGDEWLVVLNPMVWSDLIVSMGRWGSRVLWDLLPFRDFNPSFLVLGNAFIGIGAALWAAQIAGIRSVWAVTLFMGFFVLSPVWVEAWFITLEQYSRAATLILAVTQVWATLRFCEGEKIGSHIWPYAVLAVLTFVLVASFYQVHVIWSIELLGVAILMRVATRAEDFPASMLWKRYCLRALAIIVTGLVFYFMSVYFFQWFYGVEASRVADYSAYDLIGNLFADLFGHIRYFARVVLQFYLFDMHMTPAIFGWALLAGVSVYLTDQWKSFRTLRGNILGRWIFVLAVLLAILLLPFMFGIIRYIRFNMLTSASVLFAFFLAYPLQRLKPGVLRSGFAVLGFFLLFLSGYQLSTAATTKQLNNNLDMYMVTSIVEQLRHDPILARMPDNKTLVINLVGKANYGRDAPFATGLSTKPLRTSVVNCGILNCQPKRLGQAAALIGYNRKIKVKELSNESAWGWIRNHLSKEEVAKLSEQPIQQWQSNPNAGLIVGSGPEVLIVLKDLRPLP
jgi:hypothetical protein